MVGMGECGKKRRPQAACLPAGCASPASGEAEAGGCARILAVVHVEVERHGPLQTVVRHLVHVDQAAAGGQVGVREAAAAAKPLVAQLLPLGTSQPLQVLVLAPYPSAN